MSDPQALQDRIVYPFKDPLLLRRALTHRSFANEHRLTEHNERMEFLGDAVLNLVVSEQLMRTCPGASEGDLSRIRASVVSEPSLAAVGRSIGIGEHLLLGRGEEQTGGRDKDSLLADAVEAVIAAVYLDGGMEPAAALIERFFADPIGQAVTSRASSDHKTEVQELCQERLKVLPEYHVVLESGPDHRKEFAVELTINGTVYGRGSGRSKKEAEQKAAKEALGELRRQESGARSQENE